MHAQLRHGIGGQPGDRLFDLVKGEIVVVSQKLPAELPFRVITDAGSILERHIRVPRSGVVVNDGTWSGRIIAVPRGHSHLIIWVTGPSAVRPELLMRSPFNAVRRYIRWRTGWRGRLRRALGMR